MHESCSSKLLILILVYLKDFWGSIFAGDGQKIKKDICLQLNIFHPWEIINKREQHKYFSERIKWDITKKSIKKKISVLKNNSLEYNGGIDVIVRTLFFLLA